MADSVQENLSTEGGARPFADGSQARLLEQLRHATLGEYDIGAELGRGGMATVFLAHDLALDRKVAIKVMAPALGLGPGMIERFKREARTSASLSHPNIIPIYAVREAEGLLFFVMKLVEGTQLDSVIQELGQLPITMVEAILAQVGGAFGYAHRRGVVHRDIKPSNILIDEEGWAIVTDFGIAKVSESEGLTISGATVGTPTYMSPEQCTGGEITGASDQYSLGVVAYEMLTGRPPFSGPNMMAVLFSHFRDAPPPLETLRPDCPAPLRQAILRMLAKDPKERFPSMEDAIAAIGAQQLAHDDPTRTQLILLARTGANNHVASRVQTPRSPIPLHRKKPSDPAPSRQWVGPVLLGTVVLAAGIGGYAVWAGGKRGPVEPATQTEARVPPSAPPVVPPTPPQTRSEPTGAAPRKPNPERPSPSPSPSPAPAAAAAAAAAPPAAIIPTAPAPPPPPPPAVVTAPAPAPATTPERSPAEAAAALAAARFTADSGAVVAAIAGYARALEAGDMNGARRMFPGMPEDQRQGLQAFWRAGGGMRTRWSIGSVSVDGDVATAHITGANVVTAPRERESEQAVNLHARLERQAGVWRLMRLGS